MKINRAPCSTHNYYAEEWQCCVHLVAAIMYRAYQDAAGVIESTGDVLRNKTEIMRDGAAYFKDGRFQAHAEMIGLDPELKPDWSKR
jgi:hypothetical protein